MSKRRIKKPMAECCSLKSHDTVSLNHGNGSLTDVSPNDSSRERCVPWTIRPVDDASPRMMCPLDDATRQWTFTAATRRYFGLWPLQSRVPTQIIQAKCQRTASERLFVKEPVLALWAKQMFTITVTIDTNIQWTLYKALHISEGKLNIVKYLMLRL